LRRDSSSFPSLGARSLILMASFGNTHELVEREAAGSGDASSSKPAGLALSHSAASLSRRESSSRAFISPVIPAFTPGATTSLKGKTPMRSSWQPETKKSLPPQEEVAEEERQDPYRHEFVHMDSEFRGALDYSTNGGVVDSTPPGGRKRESWMDFESWRPRKWLNWVAEDPHDEDEPHHEQPDDHASETGTVGVISSSAQYGPDSELGLARNGRSFSLPHMKPGTAPGWSRLKSILQRQHSIIQQPSAAVAPLNLSIVDELISGGLAGTMLKMWFERDDRDERRVPILLHRLRIRISDSLHPMSGSKAVFRIEVSA